MNRFVSSSVACSVVCCEAAEMLSSACPFIKMKVNRRKKIRLTLHICVLILYGCSS